LLLLGAAGGVGLVDGAVPAEHDGTGGIGDVHSRLSAVAHTRCSGVGSVSLPLLQDESRYGTFLISLWLATDLEHAVTNFVPRVGRYVVTAA
jgi:hypothetical protein